MENRINEFENALEEKKAEDILVLSVADRCSFTDFFVIASGNSPRQVKAMADSLIEKIGKPLHLEGYDQGDWVLLDYGEVVAHLFHEPVRRHYNLEELWIGSEDQEILAGKTIDSVKELL